MVVSSTPRSSKPWTSKPSYQRQNVRSGYENESKGKPDPEIVCYNCWSKGHVMRNCGKPKYFLFTYMRDLYEQKKDSDGKDPTPEPKN